MLLNAIKDDKFLNSLFHNLPVLEEFELHQILVDLNHESIELTVHTSQLPEIIPAKERGSEFNYSAIHLRYFGPENIELSLSGKTAELVTFRCDLDKKRIEGYSGNRKVLSFNYQTSKLDKWNLYLREL